MEYNYKQFKRSIASKNVAFQINGHTIKCGKDTWQIANIASMSLGHRVLSIKEPKPTFNLKKFKNKNPKPTLNQNKPEFKLNLIAITIAMIITFAFAIFFKNTTLSSFLYTIVIGLVFIFINIIINNHQWASEVENQAMIWNEKKNKEEAEVKRKEKVWNGMRRNPPILYSLMLETNAGSKPLFYSFNEKQVIQTRDAIERSMEKRGGSNINITFKIDTINVGSEDSINNFGSEIYNQTINN